MTPTWTPTQSTQILDLLKVDGAVPDEWTRDDVFGWGMVAPQPRIESTVSTETATGYDHLAILACVEGMLAREWVELFANKDGTNWGWLLNPDESQTCWSVHAASRFTAAHLAYCRLHGVEAVT